MEVQLFLEGGRGPTCFIFSHCTFLSRYQSFLAPLLKLLLFLPQLGEERTPDLTRCHTPNKPYFKKLKLPGSPGELILHMHNLLQKAERMSLQWGGKDNLGVLRPKAHSSVIWFTAVINLGGSGEIGNYYVVKIDVNDIYQERGFQVLVVKGNRVAHGKRGKEERQFFSCAFLIILCFCWELFSAQVARQSL